MSARDRSALRLTALHSGSLEPGAQVILQTPTLRICAWGLPSAYEIGASPIRKISITELSVNILQELKAVPISMNAAST
jgi:hypothetical protein